MGPCAKACRAGGAIIAIKGKTREVLQGIALVIVAFFLVNVLAAEFNVTGTTLVVLNLAPSFLAIGLLLKYLDVF